ncbi:PKD domain-containing protein, partial [Flavobacteriaceae bacterium]|nr:PKD domain-containing protein [Flavobacteriaceae bacterium]
MKNLFKILKKASLLILAISFMGCDDDEAALPQLTAGFTHTINADTGTVTFINTSVNASTYAWDFGDESTSTLINPVNV